MVSSSLTILLLHHHRLLLLRPPPLPELYPGGAATSAAPSPSSPSSPLLIPFFVLFISLIFFLLGFLFRDIFSFLQPPSNKRINGLTQNVLDSFPVLPFIEFLKSNNGVLVLDCVVCLSEFEGGDNVRVVSVCGHVFHKECIDFWLESKFTCPICRADLRNVDKNDVCHVV